MIAHVDAAYSGSDKTVTRLVPDVSLIPIGCRVLLDPIRLELKQGKIILPGTADYDMPTAGTVLKMPDKREEAVRCPECKHSFQHGLPREIKVGDVVIFHKDNGTLINHESHQYVLVNEEFIVAIMTPE